MISKVTKFSGIGTLHAPLASGALTLKRRTIIYGENGRGKTTFVAVLRSLACGNTAGLLQRKTIGGTLPQVVQLLVGSSPHDLVNGKWSKLHPEICVFDTTFVSENVYSGSSVDPDHRKNLLTFAIGSQGVSLARKVDELAGQIAKKRGEEATAREQLKAFIKGDLSPEQFAYLSPSGMNAEEELEAAKKRRDAIARASSILSLLVPSPISFSGLDRRRLSEMLGETLEKVSSDAAERVRGHIESAGVKESWLEEGSRFNTGSSCPYCGQNTRGVPLVEAYKLSFSEAYKAFKMNLTKEADALAGSISGENWAAIKAAVDGNRTALIPWREFLAGVDLPFDLDRHGANVKGASAALWAAVNRKLACPLEPVTLSSEEASALDMLEGTATAVADYNALQMWISGKISDLRRSVASGSPAEAEADVYKAENQIARKSAAAQAASTAFLNTIEARKKLEKEKDEARSRLDSHMETIVSQYKDSINDHVRGCGAAFQIKELKTVYTGAKPRFEYVIELFGTSVDLANKQTSPIVFESALSFGDKSALAFAFFLAKLENDPNRAGQILVFDDPLSSLDSCRRRYTRQKIAALAPEVAQLIVLTHEETTVADIATRLNEPECAIYALKQNGDFSVFTTTSVKEIAASDYARYFDALSHYLHGSGKVDDVVRTVRPFLEMNLRYRFPEEFGADDSLGKMIGHIRSCDASKPLHKMNSLLPTLEEINEYTTNHSHGDSALINAEKILDSDLRNIVKKSLEFARGFPNQPSRS